MQKMMLTLVSTVLPVTLSPVALAALNRVSHASFCVLIRSKALGLPKRYPRVGILQVSWRALILSLIGARLLAAKACF